MSISRLTARKFTRHNIAGNVVDMFVDMFVYPGHVTHWAGPVVPRPAGSFRLAAILLCFYFYGSGRRTFSILH